MEKKINPPFVIMYIAYSFPSENRNRLNLICPEGPQSYSCKLTLGLYNKLPDGTKNIVQSAAVFNHHHIRCCFFFSKSRGKKKTEKSYFEEVGRRLYVIKKKNIIPLWSNPP